MMNWNRDIVHWLLLGMLLTLVSMEDVTAQKLIQMEKANSLKTRKFHLGEELTFSLRSTPDQFLTREIVDVYPDLGQVQFSSGLIPVGDIAAIRYPGSNRWAKQVGLQLWIAAGLYVGYSVLDVAIYQRSPTAEQYYIPVLALGTGAVFRFTIPERKHRIEGRRRLRLLDITF